MKTIDVSKNVMQKVVYLEWGRMKQWILGFVIAVTALYISFVVLGVFAFQIISERQGWDLLTLFQQDQEIIAIYWKDTLWIFWEEAPQIIIFSVAGILVLIVIIIVLTRRKRRIVQKKLHQLGQYRSK